jgi:hypothetical protein
MTPMEIVSELLDYMSNMLTCKLENVVQKKEEGKSCCKIKIRNYPD